MNLHEYQGALKNFRRSRAYCGEHHVTLYNEGLCHHYMGDLPSALNCFNHCLTLSPHYPEAVGMKSKVEMELLARGNRFIAAGASKGGEEDAGSHSQKAV